LSSTSLCTYCGTNSNYLLVILNGLFKEGFHFLREFARILVTESADVLPLQKNIFAKKGRKMFTNKLIIGYIDLTRSLDLNRPLKKM
jgi:hypothetical protein